MLRIMTTRKLAFYSPNRDERFITQGNRIIEDCPEWCKEDLMFKAAEKAGILTELLLNTSTKVEQKIQEEAPKNPHEEKEAVVKKAAAKKSSGKKGK